MFAHTIRCIPNQTCGRLVLIWAFNKRHHQKGVFGNHFCRSWTATYVEIAKMHYQGAVGFSADGTNHPGGCTILFSVPNLGKSCIKLRNFSRFGEGGVLVQMFFYVDPPPHMGIYHFIKRGNLRVCIW